MTSVVYLLRSPLNVISPFLYSKKKAAIVIAVEKPPLAGQVLETTSDCSLRKGTTLSYDELLEVLLASQCVIAL